MPSETQLLTISHPIGHALPLGSACVATSFSGGRVHGSIPTLFDTPTRLSDQSHPLDNNTIRPILIRTLRAPSLVAQSSQVEQMSNYC